MYSYSIPASLSAATICSDSACLTRGSLAPWAISSGMRMSRARDSGERDHRNSLSVSGLPTRLYSAAEHVRGERRAYQGRVAAVGPAVDRDLGRVGPPLIDRVLDRVQQVVVHLGAPLAVAGRHERLAVAGRAAVVHLDAEVTPVGRPNRPPASDSGGKVT